MANEVRLIDANALKESLKKYKVKGYNHKYVQGMQDAIDGYFPRIIDDAPTIEAEPDNGWISVKDRLPDDKERYLICTEDGRIDIAYYQPIGDKFSDYEPFWQGSCRLTTSVTHWQPLPELPKGE